MKRLLIATRNPTKFERLKKLLCSYKLQVLSLNDVGISQGVDESGKTFEENAVLKARFYAKLSNLPVLGDDSGLEIDALDGWPGVYSRRIFGPSKPDATDDEVVSETLKRMTKVPFEKRTCHFTAVMALLIPPDKLHVTHSSTDGYIITEPKGIRKPGFPMESIFYLPDLDKTAAELDQEGNLENYLTHRKNAIIKLEPYLKELEKI